MLVESEGMSPSPFLLLYCRSSSSTVTALQGQRLQKEDKEKAQGDDKFSVGVLHLGTERGTISQGRKETIRGVDTGPGERGEWKKMAKGQKGARSPRIDVQRRERPRGLRAAHQSVLGRKGGVKQEPFLRSTNKGLGPALAFSKLFELREESPGILHLSKGA